MFVRRGGVSTLAPGGAGRHRKRCVSCGIMSCVTSVMRALGQSEARDYLTTTNQRPSGHQCVYSCARGLNCETSQPLQGLALDTHYIHYITYWDMGCDIINEPRILIEGTIHMDAIYLSKSPTLSRR